jgi:hypothetical protein
MTAAPMSSANKAIECGRITMRWKFKVHEDGDEMWRARALGYEYFVYSDWRPNTFKVALQDPDPNPDPAPDPDGWSYLEGTWPTAAEARAAAETDYDRRRAIKKRSKKLVTTTRVDSGSTP